VVNKWTLVAQRIYWSAQAIGEFDQSEMGSTRVRAETDHPGNGQTPVCKPIFSVYRIFLKSACYPQNTFSDKDRLLCSCVRLIDW
jgi:hypothetical protein